MVAVFELALKRIVRQRLMLFLMLLFPIVLILLPQIGDEIPLVGFGLFGLVLMFSAFLLTKQVIEDRQYKTVIRIAASPTSHRDYLLGHIAAYMLVLMIQVVLFWILAQVSWRGAFGFYLWVLLFFTAFAFLSLSFSLFWHTFFKSYATSVAVYSVVANLLALLGGMSYPLAFMPNQIRRIAVVLPTYWYAYGIELVNDTRYLTALIALSILISFAIIFLTVGSKRRFE